MKKKALTIPRMELLALLLGSRAVKTMRNALSESFPLLDQTAYLYTDNTAVLGKVKDPKVQKEVFEENRLREIRAVPDALISYVPTYENPADIASKGMSADQLSRCPMWWEGPGWINAGNEVIAPIPPSPVTDALPYHTSTPRNSASTVGGSPLFEFSNAALSKMEQERVLWVDATKYLVNLDKTVRIAAYTLRFLKRASVRLTRRPFQAFPYPTPNSIQITTLEYQTSLTVLLQQNQLVHPPSNKDSLANSLYTDTAGVCRSKGRIDKSKLQESTLNPIYLPDSPLARLMIRHWHVKTCHASSHNLLALLRQQFWIPRGRRVVATALRCCMRCRRQTAVPFKAPPMPQLPSPRVTISAPFTHIGVDLFGPFNVWQGSVVVKVYGAIFTCLTVRAVHIEVLEDLSAEAFLRGFLRYTSIRGIPRTILSDNGTNFVLTEKCLSGRKLSAEEIASHEWQRIIKSPPVQSQTSAMGIQWTFITERAPWRGGLYEALIKSIKYHLKRVVGKNCMKRDHFHTLLMQIAAVVNCRPITYYSSETPHPLRPIDFLNPLSPTSVLFPPFGEGDAYVPTPSNVDTLNAIWEKLDRMLTQFWDGWSSDYVLSIREQRVKGPNKLSEDRVPEVGELVMVYENDLPRNAWRDAVVTQLIPSEDGQVRTAVVRFANKRETRRAINHLIPLETACERERRGLNLPQPIQREQRPTPSPSPLPPLRTGMRLRNKQLFLPPLKQ